MGTFAGSAGGGGGGWDTRVRDSFCTKLHLCLDRSTHTLSSSPLYCHNFKTEDFVEAHGYVTKLGASVLSVSGKGDQ